MASRAGALSANEIGRLLAELDTFPGSLAEKRLPRVLIVLRANWVPNGFFVFCIFPGLGIVATVWELRKHA